MKELELRGLACLSQKAVVVEYKGFTKEEPLRFDVLVEGCVLVEAKAVQEILPIHKAQLLSYMKLLNVPIGLVINFHELKLIDGVVARHDLFKDYWVALDETAHREPDTLFGKSAHGEQLVLEFLEFSEEVPLCPIVFVHVRYPNRPVM